MPIYELQSQTIDPVTSVTFEEIGIKERGDLQRLLRARIDCLGEDLMVLAEEFGDWADSSRRIDLLCLDVEANLVVVELKRTEDGGHMELQALRYAAMVSAMQFDQAVDALARSRNKAVPDHDTARADILAFLGWKTADEDRFASSTRVILVAADFSKEITTAVLWLREFEIDIRCIRLKPYRMGNGKLLLDVQPLIPLPDTAEYQTKLGEKRHAERQARTERRNERYEFWETLLARPKTQYSPYANRKPYSESWLSAGIGRTGFNLNCAIRQTDCYAMLWIANNKAAFQKFLAERATIESEYGGELDWQEVPGGAGSYIRTLLEGGYRSPREQWDTIQDRLIDAAIRLDKVFHQRVQTV